MTTFYGSKAATFDLVVVVRADNTGIINPMAEPHTAMTLVSHIITNFELVLLSLGAFFGSECPNTSMWFELTIV